MDILSNIFYDDVKVKQHSISSISLGLKESKYRFSKVYIIIDRYFVNKTKHLLQVTLYEHTFCSGYVEK
jgi:hypothetical protein